MTLRFGQNLAYLRKINKLAQKDIAKIVNKTIATVSFWEQGKREPTVQDVYILSVYFRIDIETLCFGDITNVKPVR